MHDKGIEWRSMVSALRISAPKKKRPSIVTIGGGTGQFTLLSGLKKYPVDLTAVVTMSDNGGSTGQLRDELGVLPPGDLRQCLVALSEADDVMRDLFTHRFTNGKLAGHNVGNLLISALAQTTGSLDLALERAGEILKIRGQVLPVTLNDVNLIMELQNGKKLQGEQSVSTCELISRFGIKKMYLHPEAKINKKVRTALSTADLIVIGPGNFYSSVIPNFLVSGMTRAYIQAKAKKVFVAGLMNKHGQQDDFTVGTYIQSFMTITKVPAPDVVLYNTVTPAPSLLKRYVDEGNPVSFRTSDIPRTCHAIGADLLASGVAKTKKVDLLRRTLIRHDPDKLARAIMELL